MTTATAQSHRALFLSTIGLGAFATPIIPINSTVFSPRERAGAMLAELGVAAGEGRPARESLRALTDGL